MEPKAKNYEEAAAECISALSAEDIEYFRLHIGYTHHHFGYGLYLRNRYSYLLDKEMYGLLGDDYRDGLGKSIYHLMIPMIFPEFTGYEQYIDRITDFYFDDLNANYNLKFDRNFIADIKPDEYFILSDDSPLREEDFDKWWEQYMEENQKYALAIAERILQFDDFKKSASELGYSDSEIDEIHSFCTKLIKERFLFVPLEILFAKNSTSESIKAMMRQKKIIEWAFSKHKSDVEVFPSYVFESRDTVKIMVSANGSLLELAENYKADREIVLTAVKASAYAAEFMDKALWGDREIAEEAARHSEYDLIFHYDAFKQFNDDDEIVKLALEANGANICYASERIKADYNMAVFALTHQKRIYPNSTYKSLSDELRNNKDLALLEFQAPQPSLDGFTDELLDDDDIAMKLIENEDITWMFYKMSERIKRKYLDKLPERTRQNIKEELHIE